MDPASDPNPASSPAVHRGVIGADIRSSVFRDTRTYYTTHDIVPARGLMAFARRNAGRRILDLGCATGAYVGALASLGYEVRGADANAEYVRIAQRRGLDVVHVDAALPFVDRSYDTVLLFEVLEHLSNPDEVLLEAKRVARRNILVTVPNCAGADELRERGLLPEHFADLDHRNFFTVELLGGLLRRHFTTVNVSPGDPINPFALCGSTLLRRFGSRAMRLGMLRPRYHFRLYAVASI